MERAGLLSCRALLAPAAADWNLAGRELLHLTLLLPLCAELTWRIMLDPLGLLGLGLLLQQHLISTYTGVKGVNAPSQ